MSWFRFRKEYFTCHVKRNLKSYANREDSDQTAQMCSLILVFPDRVKDPKEFLLENNVSQKSALLCRLVGEHFSYTTRHIFAVEAQRFQTK